MGGGVKEAAKMLQGLDYQNRLRVLELISKQDPEMAKILEKNLVDFEDLRDLSQKMLQELLKSIDIDDLGLALRVGSEELRSHILTNVSKSMREDIEGILKGPPRPLSDVQSKVEKILDVLRAKLEDGSVVLMKGEDDILV